MKIIFPILAAIFIVSCSSKVIVKKDSCKPIYDGALLECEEAKK